MTGLFKMAEQDLGFIIEKDPAGPRWPIVLTAPDGTATTGLTGTSNDIAMMIDPDTGVAVSGRSASVFLRISTILEKLPGAGLPRGIADAGSRPWTVKVEDVNGEVRLFKVSESNPDRMLGGITLILEAYA